MAYDQPPSYNETVLPPTYDEAQLRKEPPLVFHGRDVTWASMLYGSKPQPVTCPYCLTNVVTKIEKYPVNKMDFPRSIKRTIRYLLIGKSKQIVHCCSKCGSYLGCHQNN